MISVVAPRTLLALVAPSQTRTAKSDGQFGKAPGPVPLRLIENPGWNETLGSVAT